MLGSIYKIQNKINNKIYIGQTVKTIESRFKGHVWGAISNRSNTALARAFRKHGIQLFEISLIDFCDNKDKLNEKEKYWIQYYDCKTPNGYNLTDGGEGMNGYMQSEEHKQKISIALQGKLKSEEHKRKVGDALRGKVHSKEMNEKTSIATKRAMDNLSLEKKERMKTMKGKTGKEHNRYGISRSEESKIKNSLAQTGKKQSEETCKKKRIASLRMWEIRKGVSL